MSEETEAFKDRVLEILEEHMAGECKCSECTLARSIYEAVQRLET